MKEYETQAYWLNKVDEIEEKIVKRNKESRCASCNIQTPYLMDYSLPEDPEFVMQVCGCCLNRYNELDKWSVV